MTAVYEVAQCGHQFLSTRQLAAEIRGRIEEVILTELDRGEPFVLDFEGIEAVTGGFADELVAVLRQQYGGRIRWANANDFVADTIATALHRRADSSTR